MVPPCCRMKSIAQPVKYERRYEPTHKSRVRLAAATNPWTGPRLKWTLRIPWSVSTVNLLFKDLGFFVTRITPAIQRVTASMKEGKPTLPPNKHEYRSDANAHASRYVPGCHRHVLEPRRAGCRTAGVVHPRCLALLVPGHDVAQSHRPFEDQGA